MAQSISKIKSPSSSPLLDIKHVLQAQTIYNGEYCDVKEVNYNGRQLAIKVIYLNRMSSQSFKRQYSLIYNEIKALYTIKHENVIELLGHFEAEEYIVMFFPKFGKTLRNFVKGLIENAKKSNRTFTVQQFIIIFRQIVSAISELHNYGCVHRDISNDNILIDENLKIKVIDFGYSGFFRNSPVQLGTREFIAPQILQKKRYTYKVDIWALGILGFYLLYGSVMFKPKGKFQSDDQLTKEYLKNMHKPFEQNSDEKLLVTQKPSEELLTILKRMLSVNPQKRPQLGYILAKQAFGAQTGEDFDRYELEQYIRKTERKMNQNVKQMSIKELQETLYSLYCNYEEEMRKKRTLIKELIKVQKEKVDKKLDNNF